MSAQKRFALVVVPSGSTGMRHTELSRVLIIEVSL